MVTDYVIIASHTNINALNIDVCMIECVNLLHFLKSFIWLQFGQNIKIQIYIYFQFNFGPNSGIPWLSLRTANHAYTSKKIGQLNIIDQSHWLITFWLEIMNPYWEA